MASSGSDGAYLGLNDAMALGRRLGMPSQTGFWFGFGPLGPYPFSPPFPVKMHQIVGAPISTDGVDPADEAAVAALNRRIYTTVQELQDRARGLRPKE